MVHQSTAAGHQKSAVDHLTSATDPQQSASDQQASTTNTQTSATDEQTVAAIHQTDETRTAKFPSPPPEAIIFGVAVLAWVATFVFAGTCFCFNAAISLWGVISVRISRRGSMLNFCIAVDWRKYLIWALLHAFYLGVIYCLLRGILAIAQATYGECMAWYKSQEFKTWMESPEPH